MRIDCKWTDELAFGFGGYVAFGELGAFAEEELLHLLFHDFLRAGIEGIEAVFVHDHFGMLDPELPGVFRDRFVDALSKFAFPRRAIEAGQVAAEFDAVHHARAGLDRLICGRCVPAGIVGHYGVSSSSTFLTIPQRRGNS
jgi:hypothetical protein